MIVVSNLKGAHIIAGVVLDPGSNAILPSMEKTLRENVHFQAQIKCKQMEIIEDDKANTNEKPELTNAKMTGDPVMDEALGILSLKPKDAAKAIKFSLNISALKKVTEMSKEGNIVTLANNRIEEIKKIGKE